MDASAPRNARTPFLILESIDLELRILSRLTTTAAALPMRPPSGGRIKQKIGVAAPAGFDMRERVAQLRDATDARSRVSAQVDEVREMRFHQLVRLRHRASGALQHRRAELDLPRDVLVSEHSWCAGEHAEVPSLRVRLDESDLREVDADPLDPCVKRQTRYSHALIPLDIGGASHKMMRSALQRPHRHVAVRIADRHAIRQYEALDSVGNDVSH